MKIPICRSHVVVCSLLLLCLAAYGYTAEGRPRFPESTLRQLQGSLSLDMATLSRVPSVLQKLGKNLILENTRGERDVAVYQKAAPSVVLVLAGKDGFGSGVIISRDGRIVTN